MASVPSRLALSSKAFSNEEIFEMKLKNYLVKTSTRPSKDHAYELALELDHPHRVLSSSLIGDEHPLKEEAWTISDCFESATNGMDNPDALTKLNFIQDHSPFYYWKLLIQAVVEFYSGNTCHTILDEIPSEMPMTPMIEVLKALNKRDDKNLDDRSKRVFQQVLVKDPFAINLLEEVLDGLDTGMEDLIWHGSEELLSYLMETAPEMSKSFGLWLITQVESQDIDPQPIAELFRRVFGSKEGCRLLALGLISTDPEGSVLYWLQFLILTHEERSFTEESRKAAFAVLRDFCLSTLDYQKDEGRDDNFIRGFNGLINRIPESIRKDIFPESDWLSFENHKKTKPQNEVKESKKVSGSEPIQFDLFAS